MQTQLSQLSSIHFPLLFDGAMGTYYQARYQTSVLPEQENFTHPERVVAVHLAYLQAGATALRTNTYAWAFQPSTDIAYFKQLIHQAYQLAQTACRQAKAGGIQQSITLFANLGHLPDWLFEPDYSSVLQAVIQL